MTNWMGQAFPGYTRPRLGATIREARHRTGMTLREVADHVGIDFTYLSKIENGHEVSVSEPTIRRLADALGLAKEVDALVFMSGKIPAHIRDAMLDLDPYDAARLFRADGIGAIGRDFAALRRVIHAFVPAGVNVPMTPWQRETLDDAYRVGALREGSTA